eukprot:6286883-Alexandrium_andersonii.AAC.1
MRGRPSARARQARVKQEVAARRVHQVARGGAAEDSRREPRCRRRPSATDRRSRRRRTRMAAEALERDSTEMRSLA